MCFTGVVCYCWGGECARGGDETYWYIHKKRDPAKPHLFHFGKRGGCVKDKADG